MYEYTISKIETFEFDDYDNKDYQDVLRMCKEIKNMEKSTKAARWIGYVYRIVEELGFWDNFTSRQYAKEDVNRGNDNKKENRYVQNRR